MIDRRILAALAALHERGEPAALATVVATQGSTYRKAGARLVIAAHGPRTGMVSGGCLEPDIERAARSVMANGEAERVVFDLTGDEEALLGWGLGCDGVIDVLIQPVGPDSAVVQGMRAALEGRALSLVTVTDPGESPARCGDALLVGDEGVIGTLGDALADQEAGALGAGEAGQRPSLRTLPATAGPVEVLVERLEPPPRLLLCGAGDDALPLARNVMALGWSVVVADHRPWALEGRFEGAQAAVRVSGDADATRSWCDERTYAVVMSHNLEWDGRYLDALLATPVAYIGMLGPRGRLRRLLDASGHAGPGDDARVHGPVGLDLGADGPEEVAVSITAELIAHHRGHSGGPLRARHDPIHTPPAQAQPSG